MGGCGCEARRGERSRESPGSGRRGAPRDVNGGHAPELRPDEAGGEGAVAGGRDGAGGVGGAYPRPGGGGAREAARPRVVGDGRDVHVRPARVCLAGGGDVAYQPAVVAAAPAPRLRNRAGGVCLANHPRVEADQRARVSGSGRARHRHLRVRQPDANHRGVLRRRPEQARVARRRVHPQVGNRVAVAVELRVETVGPVAYRRPVGIGVVLVDVPVRVGVEVEMGGELVAQAGARVHVRVVGVRAAQAGYAAREGGAPRAPVGVRRRILNGVPVQIPTNRVQLVEPGYLYQAVVVAVVIAALIVHVHAAVLQRRVFARRSEIPRVIVVGRDAVHVDVPVVVYARVV